MAVISQAKLPSDGHHHHWTSVMISQHWFRWWLGAVRQQAITGTNVDLDPCRHMASLGHSELIQVQYIPRNMHTVFALLCFFVLIHWLIFPYPSGLLHWHCGNPTIARVPAKQPWWIWINTSCEFIMNDCITTTKQSTTKPCAYFLGYTVDYRQAILSLLIAVSSPLHMLNEMDSDKW